MSRHERNRLVPADSDCLRDPAVDRTMIVVTKPDWVEAYERGSDVEKPYDRKGPLTKVKGYANREQYEAAAAKVASGEQPYTVYSEFRGKFVDYKTPAPPWSQLYQGRDPGCPGYVDADYPKMVYAAGGGLTPPPYSTFESFEKQNAALARRVRAREENRPKCEPMTFGQAMNRAFCKQKTA